MEFRITNKIHLKLLGIAIVFSIIFYDYLNSILFNFFKESINIFNYSITLSFIFLTISMVIMIILHELIHGLSYTLFGGKVKYSFKFVYAATEEVTNKKVSINQFAIVLLAPVTIISILSLLLPSFLGSTVFICNLLGSIGDLYMAIGLIRYPLDSKIIDTAYGYKVI
ncbi:DUF3267 domain-containing protein [Clostridium oceanicum]|uniref:DUF3267 domain-containing protein n=1 Tax=Clostridium oceanicum TaxID=1543 RepID=A0ABN1JAB5_9CLOT